MSRASATATDGQPSRARNCRPWAMPAASRRNSPCSMPSPPCGRHCRLWPPTAAMTAWIMRSTSPPDKRSRTLLASTNTTASRKAPSNRAGRCESVRGTKAMALPEYELYAIRYATRDAQRRDHFIGGDPHDAPMLMDYFVWVAKGTERTFVIDTGFTAEIAQKRKRTFLRCPVETLALVGVD